MKKLLLALMFPVAAFAGQIKGVNAFLNNGILTISVDKSGKCLLKTEKGPNGINFLFENCKLSRKIPIAIKSKFIKSIKLAPMGNNSNLRISSNQELLYNIENGKAIRIQVHPKSVLNPHFNMENPERLILGFDGNIENYTPSRKGKTLRITFLNRFVSSKVLKPNLSSFKLIKTYQKGRNAVIEVDLSNDYPVEVLKQGNSLVLKAVHLPTYRQSKASGEARISLEFINANVRSAVRAITDVVGLNVVFDPDVNGKVSISFKKPVGWREALSAVLNPLGFTYEVRKDYIRIMSKKKVLEEASLEPVSMHIYKLNYAYASDVAKVIQPLINKGKGRNSQREWVQVDPKTNSLILELTKSDYENILPVIKQADVPNKQVMIVARIVQISSSINNDLGINWGVSAYKIQNSQHNYLAGSGGVGLPVGVIPENEIGNVYKIPVQPYTLALGFLNRSQTVKSELSIKAMEIDGKARTISQPRIVTMDNQPARIEQGIEIPYTESTVAGGGSTSYNISFKKASLILNVKPHITNDNKIIMDLEVRKDSPNYENVKLTGSNEPAINTRNVKTTVMVKNGNTLVIGGIYERTKNITNNNVPGLSRIPLLGWLFKQKSTKLTNSKLLVFITPEVVNQ